MLRVLAHRTYRHLFLAQVVSLVGTGLATVALGLLAFDLAGSEAGAVLGTALAIKMIAYVGVAPVAAAFAERVPRRALLVALDLVRAAVALCLPFVTEIWQVYLLIFVLQSASAGFTPTFQATIPDVLPDERDYTNALSLSRLAYDLESLLSPMLAAALLTVISFHALFAGTAAAPALGRLHRLGAAAEPEAGGAPRDLDGHHPRHPALPRHPAATRPACADTGGRRGQRHGDREHRGAGAGAVRSRPVAGSARARGLWRRLDGRRADIASGAGTHRRPAGDACRRSPSRDRHAPRPAGYRPDNSPSALAPVGTRLRADADPSGRLLRRSAHPEDRPALFAAQFALSHACWLLTYPLAGRLGAAAGLAPTFLIMAAVALVGILVAVRLWPKDQADAPEHGHADLEPGHAHLVDHPVDRKGRHAHAFVIDDLHVVWPRGA